MSLSDELASQANARLKQKASDDAGQGRFSRALDFLMRPNYASAGAAKALVKGDENVWEEFWKGLKGEEKETYSDVLGELGWNPTTKIGKVARGVTGFTADVLLDPTTYMGIGALSKAGRAAKAGKALKGASKVAELAPTIGKQAQAGQRALLQFGGKTIIKGEPVLNQVTKIGEFLEKFESIQKLGAGRAGGGLNIKWIKPLGMTDEAWDSMKKATAAMRKTTLKKTKEAMDAGTKLFEIEKKWLKEGVKKEEIQQVLYKLADNTVEISPKMTPIYEDMAKIRNLSNEVVEQAGNALLKDFDITHIPTDEYHKMFPQKIADTVSLGRKNDIPKQYHRSWYKMNDDSIINLYDGKVFKDGKMVKQLSKKEVANLTNPTIAKAHKTTYGTAISTKERMRADAAKKALKEAADAKKAPKPFVDIMNESRNMDLQKIEADIMEELSSSQAKQRTFLDAEIGGGRDVMAEASTFPSYIEGKELRKNKLIKETLNDIIDGKPVTKKNHAKLLKQIQKEAKRRMDKLPKKAPSIAEEMLNAAKKPVVSKKTLDNGLKIANPVEINKAVGKDIFNDSLGVIAAGMINKIGKVQGGMEFAENMKKYGKLASEASADWRPTKLKLLKDANGNSLYFKPAIADHMDEIFQKYASPEIQGDFIRKFKQLQNTWKGLVTYLNVPFHARNAVSNIWQNSLAGISPTNTAYLTAGNIKGQLKLGKKLSPENAKYMAEFVDEALSGIGWMGADIEKSLTKKPNMFFGFGQAIGETIEDHAKLAHFIAKRKKGYSAEAAADSVRKYLFDYGDLSDFERLTLKTVMPFYTWSRKNIPLQIETLIKTPEKIARLGKIKANIEGQYDKTNKPPEILLPDWLKDSLPIYLGGDAKTSKFGKLGGWLPSADLANVLEPMKTAFESVSPFFKVPVELQSNYAFFFKNEISEYEGQRKKFLGLNMPKKWVHVISQIRPLNEINNVIKLRYRPLEKDYEQQIGKGLLEYITAWKTYDNDIKYLKQNVSGKGWSPSTIYQKIQRDQRKAKKTGDKEEAKRLKDMLDSYDKLQDRLKEL